MANARWSSRASIALSLLAGAALLASQISGPATPPAPQPAAEPPQKASARVPDKAPAPDRPREPTAPALELASLRLPPPPESASAAPEEPAAAAGSVAPPPDAAAAGGSAPARPSRTDPAPSAPPAPASKPREIAALQPATPAPEPARTLSPLAPEPEPKPKPKPKPEPEPAPAESQPHPPDPAAPPPEPAAASSPPKVVKALTHNPEPAPKRDPGPDPRPPSKLRSEPDPAAAAAPVPKPEPARIARSDASRPSDAAAPTAGGDGAAPADTGPVVSVSAQATAGRRDGGVLLRLLEHGSGPGVEITWPRGAASRDRLFRHMSRCLALRSAVMDPAGRLYVADPSGGTAGPEGSWRPNRDRYSGFVRQPRGYLAPDERALRQRLGSRHALPGGAHVVRLFPRAVDAALLSGLNRLLGRDYRTAGRITGRYSLSGDGLAVVDLRVDGRPVAGAIALAGRC
jgi:hypothetical protein